MKINHLLLIFYIFILELLALSQGFTQPHFDEGAFRAMSKAERYRFIHDSPLGTEDSANFKALYTPMLAIGIEQKDHKAIWVLRFYYFFRHDALHLSDEEIFNVLTELEQTAKANDFKKELLVAEYFHQFEKYKKQKSSYEHQYAVQLRQFDRMEAFGFEQFKDYSVLIMLFQSGEFMYQLGDYDKALQFLLVAERFIEPTERGHHFYVLVLNFILSSYGEISNERKGDYTKTTEYAQKLLDFTQTFKSDIPKTQRFCQFWQGFSAIHLAGTYVVQNRFEEGEPYALEGARLINELVKVDASYQQAEYEALNVLVGLELKMKKVAEAEHILQQMAAIDEKMRVTKTPLSYFYNLRIYKNYENLYNLKGDLAKTDRYRRLIRPLQDSLNRRNDVRKLANIQKLQLAENYNSKLQLVENEKSKLIQFRNIAFAFLLFVLILAFVIYRRIQTKRQKTMDALATAEQNLETVNTSAQEQSEMVDKLNLEIEKLEHSDERNAYMAQLLNSTILTEDDWVTFRHVFDKLYPSFIEEQKILFPDLTPAETRLLVLDKLDLNLQEMANMLGVSKNTIHQTRYRLRRKIGGVS